MTSTPAPPQTESRSRGASGIVRNVTSNWAGVLVAIAVSFVMAPITVNSLGSVYYGVWTLLMQFTGYLWLFDFGVRESVVKYVAQYHASGQHEELARTVNTAVSLYSLVAAAALLCTALLAFALPYAFEIPPDAVGTARVTALLVGATIAQSFVFNVFTGVLMGLQKFYLMSQLGIVFTLTRAVIVYALFTFGYGVVALALVQFGITLLSNALVYYWCVRELPYLSISLVRPRRAESTKLLNYGKYVLVANVGDKLVFATDSIIIGMFMPISALTFYAIGGSLIEYLRSFIASAGALLNPMSSSLEARQQTKTLASVLLAGARYTMLLGVPVCIGFIFLGKDFIALWMGPQYAGEAGTVLIVLAAGNMLGLPYYAISGLLYGLGKHRFVAWSRIIEGVVNLTLSVILVQRYGLLGVALGTAIPHALVVVAFLPRLLPRFVPIGLGEYYAWTYMRPLIASVPFAVTCWVISRVVHPGHLAGFFAWGSMALIAYFVPCWLVTLKPAERAYIRGYFGRWFPFLAAMRPAERG